MAFEQRSENTSAQNAKAWASTLTPWKTLWPFFTMRTYSETKEKTQMLEQLAYVTPTTAKYNNDHPKWELQVQSIFQSNFEYVTLFVIRYKAHFSLTEYVSVSFTTLEIRFPLRRLYLHSDGHLAK